MVFVGVVVVVLLLLLLWFLLLLLDDNLVYLSVFFYFPFFIFSISIFIFITFFFTLSSALYVVDLKKFRKVAAGDRLRGQYQGLSQDPNSLSNLDQVCVLWCGGV